MSAGSWIVALLLALFSACTSEIGSGDPARGEKLHSQCLGCHGTELYDASARKVKSTGELKKTVDEWNDSMNPKFSDEEVADLVAYLNQSYYKFQ